MKFTGNIYNFQNDVVITTPTSEKLREIQNYASRYIRKNKLDVDYQFGDGEFNKVALEIFKGTKKYATYRWIPLHPRYEPHLVMRGSYWRKK